MPKPSKNRIYKGSLPPGRSDWRVVVVETPKPRRGLRPRRDVANLESGFSWGNGAGRQLSVAILCDAIGAERAQLLHEAFNRERIRTLDPHAGWEMTSAEILAWVANRQEVAG